MIYTEYMYITKWICNKIHPRTCFTFNTYFSTLIGKIIQCSSISKSWSLNFNPFISFQIFSVVTPLFSPWRETEQDLWLTTIMWNKFPTTLNPTAIKMFSLSNCPSLPHPSKARVHCWKFCRWVFYSRSPPVPLEHWSLYECSMSNTQNTS